MIRLLIIVIVLLLVCDVGVQQGHAALVKDPNVAGQFYSNDPKQLDNELTIFFAGLKLPKSSSSLIVVPHAGYSYSGRIAAQSYRWANLKAKTIIILAPGHYYPLMGASIWPKGFFRTPLGLVAVDEDFSQALMKITAVISDRPQAFDKEHALEVQLPFIQHVYGDKVRIVPIIVGQLDGRSCWALAKALHELTKNRDDVLIVLSSDMSHYHPYDEAVRIDHEALKLIKANDIEGFINGYNARRIEMCGFMPVTVGMMLAQLQGALQVDVIAYANSGDVTDDKQRVVGYGAIAFNRQLPLSVDEKNILMSIAKKTLRAAVSGEKEVELTGVPERLMQPQGVFVTLKKNGQLRGCMGQLLAQQPLAEAVKTMAQAAAKEDPRFKPITADELASVTVEISVLTQPVLSSIDQIELGKHGVIVTDGQQHQGVFLPQVATETGWSKDEFLAQLCVQKAGLKSDAYKDPAIRLYTFEANVFGEINEK